MNFPILSSLILLPSIGALFLFFTKSKSENKIGIREVLDVDLYPREATHITGCLFPHWLMFCQQKQKGLWTCFVPVDYLDMNRAISSWTSSESVFVFFYFELFPQMCLWWPGVTQWPLGHLRTSHGDSNWKCLWNRLHWYFSWTNTIPRELY